MSPLSGLNKRKHRGQVTRMKVIAFITNYEVIDKIIHHLGVTFTYERPPPAPQQEELY